MSDGGTQSSQRAQRSFFKPVLFVRAGVFQSVLGVLCGLCVPSSVAAAPVTFTKDIAPIVYAKCGTCHRPGGAAPFSLLTYESARAHATQMADVTRSGYMPPWLADA